MKTNWEKQQGNRTNFVQVHPDAVAVGTHLGHSHQNRTDYCTHDEFLSGTLQDRVLRHFDEEILDEVTEAVKEMREVGDPSHENEGSES